MAPQEVAGLQALAVKHGTSMTINPDTGLPEAFNLKSLLPVLAGVALGPAGFGLMSSLGAAATVGGISALSSGSLTKGLMDGFSAYGGSNLASGFTDVAIGDAVNAAGVQSAIPDAVGVNAELAGARSAAVAEATKNPFSTMGEGFSSAASDPSKLATAMGGYGNVAGAALPVLGATMADQATQTVTKMPSNGYIRNFDYDPMTQRARALDPVKTASLGYAAGGATENRAGDVSTVTQMPGDNTNSNSQNAFDYLNGKYRSGSSSQAAFDYLTGKSTSSSNPLITTMPVEPVAPVVQRPVSPTSNTDLSVGRYSWDPTKKAYKWVDRFTPEAPVETPYEAPYEGPMMGAAAGGAVTYAQGGLGQLGGYSDGGQLLKGPGDGVSDSIPATIANKQPARLADGEFVVPARIVSELGNGSTEAGARKLYQMMDRIQTARSKTVGKGHVAKNSRADKYLPG
jgi:hypothetical protein